MHSLRRVTTCVLLMLVVVLTSAWRSSRSDDAQAKRVYRVRIVLVGLEPYTLDVPVGARVTFVNDDPNFRHQPASSCAEFDDIAPLKYHESAETAEFADAKTCKYYDRLAPENPFRHGKIVVRSGL